jgi:peptide deformylase
MDRQRTFEDEIGRLETWPLQMVPDNHLALWRPALVVPERAFGSPQLADVVAQMWAILDGIPSGIGLAAPQVGLSIALFLVDDGEGTRLGVVNPSPLDFGSFDMIEATEGCLSLPGWRARTRRPAQFGVRGRDLEGAPLVIRGEGLLARILTHELDHLRGRLYLSRIIPGTFGPDGSEPLTAIEYRAGPDEEPE